MAKKMNRDMPLPSSDGLFGGPGDRRRSTTDNTSVNSNPGVKINAMFGEDRPVNSISRPIHRFNAALKQAYNLSSPLTTVGAAAGKASKAIKSAAKAIEPKRKKK